MMSSDKKSSTVKLFCPSLSKLVPWVIKKEDESLDLGLIANTFGLEPSTLKINNHFISRGIDFVSSSVTWKSLLSFFASRGLATGSSEHDVIVIDGRVCKPVTKRGRSNPLEIGSSYDMSRESTGLSNNTEGSMVDINLFKKIKTDTCNSGVCQPLSESSSGGHEKIKFNSLAVKRKPLVEDINPLKKKKISESSSGRLNFPMTSPVVRSVRNCIDGSISGSLKRLRIDEMIMATPGKRQR
ncbi:hypothetical protein C5167_015194 [Papaver somniferum]|uniref:Uncharacterized protein n=1 Tax=Papaver somniferum TaxID=3469 RepID=A0A4Y7J8F5_PAPSO|nr:uncharacterized protein LOC113361958 [Papaver somniferum]RZC56342.1 hypothetical protein C5167_015194 [Papaver somniferum]